MFRPDRDCGPNACAVFDCGTVHSGRRSSQVDPSTCSSMFARANDLCLLVLIVSSNCSKYSPTSAPISQPLPLSLPAESGVVDKCTFERSIMPLVLSLLSASCCPSSCRRSILFSFTNQKRLVYLQQPTQLIYHHFSVEKGIMSGGIDADL